MRYRDAAYNTKSFASVESSYFCRANVEWTALANFKQCAALSFHQDTLPLLAKLLQIFIFLHRDRCAFALPLPVTLSFRMLHIVSERNATFNFLELGATLSIFFSLSPALSDTHDIFHISSFLSLLPFPLYLSFQKRWKKNLLCSFQPILCLQMQEEAANDTGIPTIRPSDSGYHHGNPGNYIRTHNSNNNNDNGKFIASEKRTNFFF